MMFIEVLFLIGQYWKQPKCSSMEEWINQLWLYPYIQYYLLSNKKKQGYWYTQDGSRQHMLSEKSQTQNIRQCKIPFIWHSRKAKTVGTETGHWLPGDRVGRRGGFTAELFWVVEVFSILIALAITLLHTFVKTHNTVYLKG